MVDVRQVMRAQEYRDAGLDNLTPNEIVALNAWITNFLARVPLSSRLANASPSTQDNMSVIESGNTKRQPTYYSNSGDKYRVPSSPGAGPKLPP